MTTVKRTMAAIIVAVCHSSMKNV